MKRTKTGKRLLALILALSMVMSLLSTSAWAADTSADGSGDPAVSSTEPQEAEPEEAEPEGEAAQPEEAETKPKEEQPKPKMKAKKQSAMSLTTQATTEYTSLKQGDVLHLGDTINSTTEYAYADGATLNPNTGPYTLVRGNIDEGGMGNESETGAYYLLKSGDGTFYHGVKFGPGGPEGGYWPVTDTSDGISVTSVVTGEYFPVVTFAVHEAPAHTHSFTYSASGATITATCANTDGKCTLPESSSGAGNHVATLTIGAPTLTYVGQTGDGISAEATFTDENAIKGSATVKYYNATADGTAKDGAALAAAPTAGGKYWAEITLTNADNSSSATAHVVYDISDPEYTITITTPTNLGQGTVTANKDKAKFNEVVTLSNTPATGYGLASYKVTKTDEPTTTIDASSGSFSMPAYPVTVTAIFEGLPFGITTVIEPAIGGTVNMTGSGVATENNVTTAKAGTEVTLASTTNAGFDFAGLTVKSASGTDLTVTNNKFTMPTEPVTVSATFIGHDTTASLEVNGSGGTAELLDDSYNKVTSVSKKAGEKFLLRVSPEDEYEYTVKFGTNNATKKEVGKTEYEAYLAYANSKNISVSPNTVLYWVTMPGAAEDTVTATVEFRAPTPYTILYQPEGGTNPDAVFCKIAVDQGGTEVVKYAMMSRGATLGDTTVWSLTITSSFDPKKIAFVGSNAVSTDDDKNALKNQLQSATPSTATVSQATDSWNNATGGGQYLIIGGNAKVVTAIFVADPDAMTTFKDNTVSTATSTTGVTYQFAVCPTDSNGTVTSFGTVQAPAAPTPAPEGKEFVGWRGFKFDSINAKATDETYNASATINVRENTTFTAVWKPSTPTITLNLNGGTMSGQTPTSVTYNTTLSLGTPTRSGYAFDRWTVSEAVTESGTYFAKGSTFDFSKPITENLKLTAQWKHVHSYKCYQISSFGSALAKYEKYGTAIHVAACGCGDVQLVAHEFDATGKCKCGYSKSGTETVTLDVSYYKEGSTPATIQGGQQTVKRNEEVEICAPGKWGESEFSKWEYKIGSGAWTFLTADAYASFLIPATMSVRAVYTNKVTQPTVKLSSSKFKEKVKVDGNTYDMDNLLFQMNYKLPDGCTFVDGGIKLGDNGGISYYFIQQVRMSYDNESKGIIAGIGAGLAVATAFTDGLFEAASNFNEVAGHMNDTGIKYNYLETEENVLEKKLTPETLAQYMYEGKPVNVEKYKPIYWEAKVPTKGMSGSIATAPPGSFARKNNGNHYIYGIAWMRYKDRNGNIRTIYTNAINPTLNSPTKTVPKTGPVQ